MNGILNINKPPALTSYDVIRQVKRITGEKKIGHCGTLDPFAEGVLPLFLGKMTKLVSYYNQSDKTYSVETRLGACSTTLDRDGEITEEKLPTDLNETMITKALLGFEGDILQVPPLYSAVKFKGKRLYQYARQGETVTLKPRKQRIYFIKDIEVELPFVRFVVHCSKGTYIRKLAEDFSAKLGTVAYLTKLTRTACGEFFLLENAIKLDQMKFFDKIRLEKSLIAPRCVFPQFQTIQTESGGEEKRLWQGMSITVLRDSVEYSQINRNCPECMVFDRKNRLIAIGVLESSQEPTVIFKPKKILMDRLDY